jgi:hypothetical protein
MATVARQITHGPGFHWFGYYDKLQFDPSGRHVLAMEAGFEGRQPTPEDEIRLGTIDLAQGDRWREIGSSRAWNWQQGCMLQWIPGSSSEVIWNDREKGRFVSRVLDLETGRLRTLPLPVYALSADGRTAVCPDFARLDDTRPGYGYPGVGDPNRDVAAPESSGLWTMDLRTGASRLVFTLAQAAAIPWEDTALAGRKTWFNHLLWNPSGRRFVFLNRCAHERHGLWTRMFTMAPDASDLRVVDGHGFPSHFIWRDDGHILEWSRVPPGPNAFYLFEDGTDHFTIVGRDVMTHNGHVSYLPGHGLEWILNDTYPLGPGRAQELYLFHVPTARRLELGAFPLPKEYTGPWRCDLHPRSSRDGTLVTIDSAHTGQGRQLFLLEVTV